MASKYRKSVLQNWFLTAFRVISTYCECTHILTASVQKFIFWPREYVKKIWEGIKKRQIYEPPFHVFLISRPTLMRALASVQGGISGCSFLPRSPSIISSGTIPEHVGHDIWYTQCTWHHLYLLVLFRYGIVWPLNQKCLLRNI